MTILPRLLCALALGAIPLTAACSASPSVATQSPPSSAPPPAAEAGTAQAAATAAPGAPGDFRAFLAGVADQAAQRGIRPDITAQALAGIEPIAKVIELDRRQPETTMTWAQYFARVVSPAKVERGRKMMAENRALLAEIEQRYHVPPQYVVALWGIETDYGRVTGGYPVVAALATLAYDGRRSSYFRGELLNALQVLDQGHITPDRMIGSWAGAMGQCQFMPSSFLRFAADGDGDGRRDIWTDRADVFASASNYLAQSGWRSGQGWGRAVKLPAGFAEGQIGLDVVKPVSAWAKLGVKGADGKPLPDSDIAASLVRADKDGGAPFLVHDNFRTILKWNRSTFFALAAGHLADKIAAK